MKVRKVYITLIIIIFFQIIFSANIYSVSASELNTYSASIILVDSVSGKIIYEKNANERMYPASITKVMTAILVIEECKLDEMVKASFNAITSVPADYSSAKIQVGEELSVEDLLNVLLVASANDAANVLAEYVAGNQEGFAAMMNAKAEELGCKNTNFMNPSGMHNDSHYTTAYDMSLVVRYAMKNPTFRSIVAMKTCALPATEIYQKIDRTFNTTNELMRGNNTTNSNYFYEYAIGVKTGYTSKSKDTLIAAAAKDSIELIAVIMKAEQTENKLSARYVDAKTLFNFAFEEYMIKDIINENEVVKQIKISNATAKTKNLDLLIQGKVSGLIKKADNDKEILPDVKLNENLKAPINKGDIVGTVRYELDGAKQTLNLLAGNDVAKSKIIWILLGVIVVLFIAYIIWNIFYMEPKKKRRKRKGSNMFSMKYK